MSYTVLTAKGELAAMLHGTTLSQVENIDGVLNRAARQVLLDIDPYENKMVVQMQTPIYYGVFDYHLPVDIKGNKVIDIIPQVPITPRPVFVQTYNQFFDVYKQAANVNNFTILSNKGVKTIRIAYNNQSRSINVNSANAIQGNGTWVASGTMSNLQDNPQYSDNNQPVIQFDITTGTGLVTNSTMQSVDLSSSYNQAAFFFDFYFPDITKVTSVGMRIGTDASNYYEKTGITTSFLGNPFVNGYNQAYALWSDMTIVGAPDPSDISYVQLEFVVPSATIGAWFAQVWNRLGFIANLEYYSKYMFEDAITGDWQETVTDDSNIINLATDSYNIFLYQAAFLCVQQALGQDAGYDTNIFLDKYNSSLDRYKKMYKSELQKAQIPYYTRTFTGYGNWLGNGYRSY